MGTSHQLYDGKVIIRARSSVCDTPDELLASRLFREVLKRFIDQLAHQNSRLLAIFPNPPAVTPGDLRLLVKTLAYLVKLPVQLAPQVLPGAEVFTHDTALLNDFVEQLYNYWRSLHRLVVCESAGDRFDQRPYRTFNDTVEKLMHVVRSTYRDIQENISGSHPRIYRQVSAGAEVGAIARPMPVRYPNALYKKLNAISIIRQVLIYPPMIFNSPTNKRSGMFERVERNPLDGLELNPNEWLCYPARVGSLLVMIYINISFFELGFSLCNLFELAGEEELKHQPDAIFLFGTPVTGPRQSGTNETVFFDDEANDLLVATVPLRDDYGYFGYLKKMALTLHNIKMLKRGRLPFHGAMFHIAFHQHPARTFLIVGDTGAGKSETLEALRGLIRDDVENLVIIADDMGSLEIDRQGRILGYGTEMGAFVRLDDLQSGYAFGQMDRSIIMNPDQVNARVVLPVTRYDEVVKGYPVDVVFYANNYEAVDAAHPVIEAFNDPAAALDVFRTGAVMSKGTTTSSGLVQSFYANIFGPPQYPELQEALAQKFYAQFFKKGLYVGQLRTQLGIAGMERLGPEQAAKALLEILK